MRAAGRVVKDLPFSFSSQCRLRSQSDLQSVFKQSQKVAYQRLLALYRPNQRPLPRLGLVITKHRIKRAIDRNRIRRVIRESFRHHQEVLKGLDIIVLMRSECTPLDKKALRDNVDHLWLQLVAHISKLA